VTGSKRRRNKNRRFEAASALVIGRARPNRASKPSPALWGRLRIILIVLAAVTAAGAVWLTLDDRFYVYHADVVGTARLSPDEVFQASGLPGIHVLWVRSEEVEARLLAALPSLERAQVACGLLDRCTIVVAERWPRMVWNDDGRLWWVDAEGVVFPAQDLAQAQEVLSEGLMVRGPLPQNEEGQLDERVRVALAELWAVGVDALPSLTYVPARGLVFVDEQGWRVILGQGPGMDRRLQVLEWLEADLEARSLTPRFVDVRFPDAPYYSLTNEW